MYKIHHYTATKINKLATITTQSNQFGPEAFDMQVQPVDMMAHAGLIIQVRRLQRHLLASAGYNVDAIQDSLKILKYYIYIFVTSTIPCPTFVHRTSIARTYFSVASSASSSATAAWSN